MSSSSAEPVGLSYRGLKRARALLQAIVLLVDGEELMPWSQVDCFPGCSASQFYDYVVAEGESVMLGPMAENHFISPWFDGSSHPGSLEPLCAYQLRLRKHEALYAPHIIHEAFILANLILKSRASQTSRSPPTRPTCFPQGFLRLPQPASATLRHTIESDVARIDPDAPEILVAPEFPGVPLDLGPHQWSADPGADVQMLLEAPSLCYSGRREIAVVESAVRAGFIRVYFPDALDAIRFEVKWKIQRPAGFESVAVAFTRVVEEG